MLSRRSLVTFDVDDKKLLRSEILGMEYMFEILGFLGMTNASEETIFRYLREELQETVEEFARQRLLLLKRLETVLETSAEELYLTKYGKKCLYLLSELNLGFRAARPLSIVRRNIPGTFYRLARSIADRISRVVIVSPWISDPSVVGLSKIIRQFGIATYVVSRRPETLKGKEALDLLKAAGATININKMVHAKLYACEAKPESIRDSFAIVGSANLTRNARLANIEVGILISGVSDTYLHLIQNLIQSSYDLKTEDLW